MRLFYAMIPPPQALEALARAQQALREAGSGRFTARERLHLTLRFLGERDEAGLLEAMDCLEGAAAKSAPCNLQLAGIASFGRIAHARVRGGEELDALARGLGLTERFAAHITLARDYAKRSAFPDIEPVAWMAREAHLVQSVLGANARYVIRKTVKLGGRE